MSITGDIYEGGGAKPVSWPDVGDTIEGEIVAIRSRQLQKFNSQELEVWPDGSPKMTPIVTVQTESYEDDDDDGRRDVYLRSNLYTAFGQALREAFKSKPEDGEVVGCSLKMQFHKQEKSGKGQPRKLFRARLTRKSVAGDAWDQPVPEAPAEEAPKNGKATPAKAKAASSKPAASNTAEDEIPF